MSSIAVPDFTGEFAAGFVATTSPCVTVFEHCVEVVDETVRPACPIAVAAANVVSPDKLGIGKFVPGASTVKVTVSPVWALEPPTGFCEITVPGLTEPEAGTVEVKTTL
jgi:hypothetical protein